jgi:predicted lipoprotein with Yx(FWY)xxD motif
MKRKLSYQGILLAGIPVILLFGLIACTPAPTSTPTPSYTIMTMNKADIGDYLVDGKGMTLYYFTKDTAGMSNATAQVIANWPIFYAANIMVPSNLNASDFGTISGFDGQKQTTYKGWPLYYYINDHAAGDTSGDGVNGVWFLINPPSTPAAPSGS